MLRVNRKGFLLPVSAWWIIAGAINVGVILYDMYMGLTNNGQGGGGGF